MAAEQSAPVLSGCSGAGTTTAPAGEGLQHDADLPVNPFVALRVAFGMLLGEDDFRVLMGNPRGKQMLHTAWLHGPGVLWGFRVAREDDQLVVSPGLAVDAHGRELHLDHTCCRSLQEWAAEWRSLYAADTAGEATSTVEAWVVAEFAGCPDRAVPALADPCDVTRQHDDYSRVVESVSISVRPQRPQWPHIYHRVRALLGLEPVEDGDQDVRDAVDAVHAADPYERPGVLLEHFGRLAARDVMDRAPELEPGDVGPGVFPVTDDHAGVVLARLTAEVTDHGACVSVGTVSVDPEVRTALLPTSTIQELTCGRAPAVFGPQPRADAGGPRLRTGTVQWERGNSRVSFRVTAPIAEGSQESGIEVSSLSGQGRGWAPNHIDRITLHDGGERVVVDLDEPPAYRMVRLVIRGTGPTPLYGRNPLVPFAGVEGGPPGTQDDGHDAVHTVDLSRAGQEGRSES